MIDLSAVSYAVCVARHKSFNAAAKFLGVEQSLLSRRIKSLEDSLGFQIFDRSPHGVTLTKTGTQYVKYSEGALQAVTYAIDSLSWKNFHSQGEISIGVAAPFSDYLYGLLSDFRGSNLDVAIHLVEGSKTETLRRLSNAEIDLAIIHDQPIGDDCELNRSDTNHQSLWSTKLFVALPRDHKLANDSVIELKSILSDRILVGSYGCDTTMNDYHLALNAVERRRLNIEQHMVSREDLIHLVEAGMGITFTNETRAACNNSSVVIKPISGGVDRLSYCGVWLPKNDNPAFRSFLGLALAKSSLNHAVSKARCSV